MSARVSATATDVEIRLAQPDDVHAISAIYAWHVLNGRASFEETPPSIEEMRERMKKINGHGLPWLVALYRGVVVGYCYASPYRPRPAYRYTVEESIYLDTTMTGLGIGSALLNEVKQRYPMLSLEVYQKNGRAVNFYHALGFRIEDGAWQEQTKHPTWIMRWQADQTP